MTNVDGVFIDLYKKDIRKLELEEFPQFKFADLRLTLGLERTVVFAPSFHFTPPYQLMTEEVVNDLIYNGKRLLSVGCGPSYLERLLAKRLGIKQEQIILADISATYIPPGFEFYQFDMYESWPDFGESLDYIIFPMCISVSIPFGFWGNGPGPNKKQLFHVITNSLDVLNPGGQIRMNGHELGAKFVTQVVQMLPLKYYGTRFAHYGTKLLTFEKMVT